MSKITKIINILLLHEKKNLELPRQNKMRGDKRRKTQEEKLRSDAAKDWAAHALPTVSVVKSSSLGEIGMLLFRKV